MSEKEAYQLTARGTLVAIMLKHGVSIDVATAISQDADFWEAALNHLHNRGFILPGGINPELAGIKK